VGQRLDVVDDGRVRHGGRRVEPLLVGAHEPRHRELALDDLEHPGLLAEQVGVGAGDDLDAVGVGPPGVADLGEGGREPLDGAVNFSLIPM
jgi:hypothetical protein